VRFIRPRDAVLRALSGSAAVNRLPLSSYAAWPTLASRRLSDRMQVRSMGYRFDRSATHVIFQLTEVFDRLKRSARGGS
jgi:hypothetical protein